jgi:hypothetical protein
MSKSIHPIEQEELMAYLDGELEANRASVAATHLERCKECQKLAADLRDLSHKLRMWEAPLSDSSVTPELAAALDENAPEKKAAKQERANRRARRSWREILGTRRYWAYGFASTVFVVLLISISLPYFMKSRVLKFAKPEFSQHVPESKQVQKELSGKETVDLNGSTDLTTAIVVPQSAPAAPTPALAPQPKRELRYDSGIPTGPMIVRTVELALITTDFDQARKNLEDALKRHHGYFGNMTAGGAADAGRSLDAVLRVPADQLDAALAELKKLGRVESESQKGDEVSQQYVDLQARLTNARNTEQRLTDLLRERTGRLSDVLEVEEQIDSVRQRIEQMDAEKKNLANQVAFATLSLKMREDYKAQVQMVPPSTSTRIRNALVEGYEAVVAALIGIVLFLASWGPSLVLWSMILFFPVRGLWRRLRRARATV